MCKRKLTENQSQLASADYADLNSNKCKAFFYIQRLAAEKDINISNQISRLIMGTHGPQGWIWMILADIMTLSCLAIWTNFPCVEKKYQNSLGLKFEWSHFGNSVIK